MYYEIAQKIIKFTTSRRPTFWVTIIGLFVVMLLLYRSISTSAFIYVSVNTIPGISSPVQTVAITDSGEHSAGNTGLILAPRDTKSITVSQGENIRTTSPISLPWYGFVHKSISLKRDNNADKVAYQSTLSDACATYDPSSEKLLSYKCSDSVSLMSYEAPNTEHWGNKKIASVEFTNRQAMPYRGGLIGTVFLPNSDHIAPRPIGYILPDGSQGFYNKPAELDNELLTDVEYITDTSDPLNQRFAIVSTAGDIYLGTPRSNSEVTYVQFPAPSQTYQQVLCRMHGETVYCYRGEAPGNHQDPRITESTISILSFNDPEPRTQPTDIPIVTTFDVTNDGHMYARHFKTLFTIKDTGGKYVSQKIAKNIDYISGGGDLYFIQKNRIFMYDNSTGDMHQVFYSPNITPKSIHQTDDRSFILSTTKAYPSIVHAYSLNNSVNTTPGKRLIDIIPLTYGQLPNVYSQDLVGDRLRITLEVNPSNVTTSDIDEKKQTVLNNLPLLGVNIDSSKILFTY